MLRRIKELLKTDRMRRTEALEHKVHELVYGKPNGIDYSKLPESFEGAGVAVEVKSIK